MLLAIGGDEELCSMPGFLAAVGGIEALNEANASNKAARKPSTQLKSKEVKEVGADQEDDGEVNHGSQILGYLRIHKRIALTSTLTSRVAPRKSDIIALGMLRKW